MIIRCVCFFSFYFFPSKIIFHIFLCSSSLWVYLRWRLSCFSQIVCYFYQASARKKPKWKETEWKRKKKYEKKRHINGCDSLLLSCWKSTLTINCYEKRQTLCLFLASFAVAFIWRCKLENKFVFKLCETVVTQRSFISMYICMRKQENKRMRVAPSFCQNIEECLSVVSKTMTTWIKYQTVYRMQE